MEGTNDARDQFYVRPGEGKKFLQPLDGVDCVLLRKVSADGTRRDWYRYRDYTGIPVWKRGFNVYPSGMTFDDVVGLVAADAEDHDVFVHWTDNNDNNNHNHNHTHNDAHNDGAKQGTPPKPTILDEKTQVLWWE